MIFSTASSGVDADDLKTTVKSLSKEGAQLTITEKMALQPRQKIIKLQLLHSVFNQPVALELVIFTQQLAPNLAVR